MWCEGLSVYLLKWKLFISSFTSRKQPYEDPRHFFESMQILFVECRFRIKLCVLIVMSTLNIYKGLQLLGYILFNTTFISSHLSTKQQSKYFSVCCPVRPFAIYNSRIENVESHYNVLFTAMMKSILTFTLIEPHFALCHLIRDQFSKLLVARVQSLPNCSRKTTYDKISFLLFTNTSWFMHLEVQTCNILHTKSNSLANLFQIDSKAHLHLVSI